MLTSVNADLRHRQEDIADPVRYIWMVSHNVLANHYRERARVSIGIPDDASENTDHESVLIREEATQRLCQEIARLGCLQREFLLQNVYQSDWFILHCLSRLVRDGLLMPPTDDKRRSLHTVLLTE